MVLLQLLVCMGVLSSSTDTQVQAVQLKHLAQMGAFAHNQLALNQLLNEDDAAAVELADVQALEQAEAVQAAEVDQTAEAQAQAVEDTTQAVVATEEQQATEVAQEQVVEEVQQPVAPKRRVAARPVPNTPAVQQAAALAAAAEELYPDESKMSAAQKQKYRLKKARDAAAEKKRLREKDALENPTVDENGEHIQTVAEAKEEARQLQAQLEAGEAAVEEHLAQQAAELAATPPAELAQQEVANSGDDGHEETVEEVKAKMAALQKGMDEGIAATDNRVQTMQQEVGDMPDFGALANLHSSISSMSKNRKKNQMKTMAENLGVDLQPGEDQLPADELTQTLIARAKEAGKSEEEINAAIS